jgi:hypothetical protein
MNMKPEQCTLERIKKAAEKAITRLDCAGR